MFPSDLWCRRMLRCCVEASGIMALGKGPCPVRVSLCCTGLSECGVKAAPPCPPSQESRLLISAVKDVMVAKSRTFPLGTPELDAAVWCSRDGP